MDKQICRQTYIGILVDKDNVIKYRYTFVFLKSVSLRRQFRMVESDDVNDNVWYRSLLSNSKFLYVLFTTGLIYFFETCINTTHDDFITSGKKKGERFQK